MLAAMSGGDRARVGLVGLGGYAGEILRLLRAEAAASGGNVRLTHVFAPDPENHGPTLAELAAEGVAAVDSYDALLAGDVDAVWLPVPIHLHRPLAERALAAGKTVMLEKPVAGCVDDHDALTAAGGRVLVGFQDVFLPATGDLKRRLLAGDFGTPTAAAVRGVWPRDDAYYARNGWAGALRREGAWVLDSPLSNAMAHFVNLALFLLGPTPEAAAMPTVVAAELWRARAGIENFDTCGLRVGLDDRPDLVVNYSHAATPALDPRLFIDTDRGTLDLRINGPATFTPRGESTETVGDYRMNRGHMARALGDVVLGRAPAVPVSDLTNSRPHTLLVSAVAQAARIVDVPAGRVAHDGGLLNVAGLSDAVAAATAARRTLGEHGVDLPTGPGRLGDLRDYRHFAGPA